MNKHIHKRYFNEGRKLANPEVVIEVTSQTPILNNKIKELKKNEYSGFFLDKDNKVIAQSVLLENSGIELLIPIPRYRENPFSW